MTPTLDVANFLIIRAAVAGLQTSLVEIARRRRPEPLNGARRVATDAATFGRRTLSVALLLVAEAEAEVVDGLGVEPAVDVTAQKYNQNG